MPACFITLRSVTFAQRGEEVLQRNHIFCTMQRTPKWMETRGCGYCLRLRQEDGRRAVALLRQYQVPFRKLYIQTETGSTEEVPL